jgi:phi13 family phage major tail protein
MGVQPTTKQIKSSKIALSNVHIAEYDRASMKWGRPVRVETIKSMSVSVTIASTKEYADDNLFEVIDSTEDFVVDLSFTDLTPSEQAFFLGFTEVGAIKLSGSDDNPPYIALLGERAKADKTKRLFSYFCGRARATNESAQTKGGGSVAVQPDNLQITFGPLPGDFPVEAYRNKARAIVDETDPEYDGEAEIWYEEVIPGQTIEDEPGDPSGA